MQTVHILPLKELNLIYEVHTLSCLYQLRIRSNLALSQEFWNTLKNGIAQRPIHRDVLESDDTHVDRGCQTCNATIHSNSISHHNYLYTWRYGSRCCSGKSTAALMKYSYRILLRVAAFLSDLFVVLLGFCHPRSGRCLGNGNDCHLSNLRT